MARYIRNLNGGKAAFVENEAAFREEWDAVYGARAKYVYFDTDEATTLVEETTTIVEETTTLVDEATSVVEEAMPEVVEKKVSKKGKYPIEDKQRF